MENIHDDAVENITREKVMIDSNGEVIKSEEELEAAFAKVDQMRHEKFKKETIRKKEKYIHTLNMVLSDKEISMHQVVFNEPGENGMVKLSVREFINMTSDYAEKRDDVSRVILKAYYSNKDIMAALREYCARKDIAKWIKNTVQ